ncbi:MAG: hypothetical protein LBI29_02755 [Rickettsiales bacterium]|jgi:hypothetical protein|nr:hypothetical protein [Rickettsiales bacterium]
MKKYCGNVLLIIFSLTFCAEISCANLINKIANSEIAKETFRKAASGGAFSVTMWSLSKKEDDTENDTEATKLLRGTHNGATAGLVGYLLSSALVYAVEPSTGKTGSTNNNGLLNNLDIGSAFVEAIGGGTFIGTSILAPRVDGTWIGGKIGNLTEMVGNFSAISDTRLGRKFGNSTLVLGKIDDWIIDGAVPGAAASIGATAMGYILEGMGKPTSLGARKLTAGIIGGAVEGAAYNVISNLLPASNKLDVLEKDKTKLHTVEMTSWRFVRGAICNGGAYATRVALFKVTKSVAKHTIGYFRFIAHKVVKKN